MLMRVACCASSIALATVAAGQPVLYGVRANGDIVRINPGTGVGELVASTGVACQAAAGYTAAGRYWQAHYILLAGSGAQADQIFQFDFASTSVYVSTTGRPAGYSIRGMELTGGALYVVLSTESPSEVDLLARIAWNGQYTVIGPTGRADLEGLAAYSGALYALGSDGGGTLCTLDTVTGAATVIGGGGFGADTGSLDFFHNGALYACGSNLLSVNAATGAATLVGPTGFTDIRGLGALPGCYADCASGAPPTLNVMDFTCFLQRYAAGEPWANCDMSTTPPVLNVADFTCFLRAYASGCE